MRIIWLVLFMALLAGCGSGGGMAGNVVDPPPDPGPSTATIAVGTRAASVETVLYGVQFLIQLPAGVTVPADPDGKVIQGVLQTADPGVTAAAKLVAATAETRAFIRVNVADAGGFVVGNLATLKCDIVPGATVSAADFALDGFVAKDQDGAAMEGVTAHFSVQLQ